MKDFFSVTLEKYIQSAKGLYEGNKVFVWAVGIAFAAGWLLG